MTPEHNCHDGFCRGKLTVLFVCLVYIEVEMSMPR